MPTKSLLTTILAALEPMKTTHGVKTVAAYSGQLSNIGVAVAPFSTPAVLVNFHADKMTTVDQAASARSFRLLIFVMAGDVSKQARAESCADLIDEIRALLHNKNLGEPLTQPFRVMSAELTFDAPLFLGYALSVEGEIYEDYQ